MKNPLPAGATHDPKVVDALTPHLHYSGAHWVSVTEPGPVTLELVRRLLSEAHGLAATKFARKQG